MQEMIVRANSNQMQEKIVMRSSTQFALAASAIAIAFGGYLLLAISTRETSFEALHRLNSSDLYNAFKIFKMHLVEDGPDLFVDAVKNHTFQSNSLTVS